MAGGGVDGKQGERHRSARPRDAASLLLLDRAGLAGKPYVLMGRRHAAHVFMPDVYVFPGGRRDPADHRAPVHRDLHEDVLARLTMRAGGLTARGARALAVAALRDTHEETGVVLHGTRDGSVGDVAERLPAHDLAPLRFVARAVTPPGRTRRFDARFFACFADEIGAVTASVADSDELLDLRWVALDTAASLPTATITRMVLADLERVLQADPGLPFGRPVPYYRAVRGRLVRDLL